jgi:hypothetical protein
MSRHSSVGIETNYGLDGLGFKSRQVQEISSTPERQHRLWDPFNFLLLGTADPGRDIDHSPPSIAEAKNEWSYTCIPSLYLHAVHKNNFTFYPFVRNSDHTVLHDLLNGKDVEGKVCGPNLRHYPGICLEGLRKATKYITEASPCSDQDSKGAPN